MKLRNKILNVSLLSAVMFAGSVLSSNAMPTSIYSGVDRAQTSIKSSDMMDSKAITIASGDSYADALSAYNIASWYKTKLILVSKDTDLSNFIKNKQPDNIFIVGGPSSLNGLAINQINDYALMNNVKIERISGIGRYETNMETLKKTGYKTVGVADGRNFPDALSSIGLLSNKQYGLKLVDGSMPYNASGLSIAYTFGGTNSVHQNGGKRLFGGDRYTTSQAINNELGVPENIAVSLGNDFPDALSALNIVIANKSKTASMIVDKSQTYFTDGQAKYAVSAKSAYLLGGQLPSGIIQEIKAMPKLINKPAVKPTTYSYKPNPPASKPVVVQSNNPSGVTAAKLNAVLKGPCTGKGQFIIDLSNKYKQDPALMVSIMGAETGFGRYIRHTNNPMSVLWNRAGRSTYPTIEAGIESGIKNIATNKAYNNCRDFNAFARVYLGYESAEYKNQLNKYYTSLTGRNIYSVRVR